jgi:hypothetical protein
VYSSADVVIVFNADEHLAGLNPTRGAELCTVVETMYSGSYTYQAFGNNCHSSIKRLDTKTTK